MSNSKKNLTAAVSTAIDPISKLRTHIFALDASDTAMVLDDLFHTWISSDNPEYTDSDYRSKVVNTYQLIKGMVNDMNTLREGGVL